MEITRILSRSLHRYFDARLGYSSAGCFPALPASAFPSEVDRATGCVATQEDCGLKVRARKWLVSLQLSPIEGSIGIKPQGDATPDADVAA